MEIHLSDPDQEARLNLPSNVVKRRGELSKASGGAETAPAVTDNTARPGRGAGPEERIAAGLVQLVLVCAILIGGYMAMEWLIASSPKAERKAPGRVARLVEVTPVRPATQGPVIQAWGDVRAAQTLIVRPEIAGRLVWVHPEVTRGGRIQQGDVVARFDDRDLKLALARVESDIADIQARIVIERGQAEIGRRELTRLSRNLTDKQRALVLREPQMAQLRAELAAAEADREQAQNALEKAEVKAPFDAIVLEEAIAPGAMLAAGAEAATLVAADRFHVALAVPTAALEWIRVDGTQTVGLTQPGLWPENASRDGVVVRMGSAVTETGRMAELIVDVPNPMGASSRDVPVLLLGSFLRGTIEGPQIPGAVALDRAYLRDDDTVWVFDAEGKLEVRAVDVAWRGPDAVLIRAGLEAGERIVTTNLVMVAPGMALRVRDEVSG